MASDLFAGAASRPGAAPLTVFRAELIGHEQTSWEALFDGFIALKAITFSSSIEFLMRLADRLDEMEVVFGAESILSREHLSLLQASSTVQAYGFADALADQKALVEALSRLLGRSGRALLERVAAGTLRFRLLRGRPSHEKLYLLSGPAGHRVVTGSANLSLAAFEGRQHEVHVVFDGEPAWALFGDYYRRDWRDSIPVEPDALVSTRDGETVSRDTPLALEEVPIVRVMNAGVALVDQPPRPAPTGFAGDALRTAAALGAELKDLALPKDKAGRTVVNAASVLRVIRTHQARPLAEVAEDRIPRADIDWATGSVLLDGHPWLHVDDSVPPDAVVHDARILADYLDSFHGFFGNAEGAIEVYWAFLVWLYAAPAAPWLRQAAVPVGIDPWVYPVYAVLFGRSSGGKTLFTRVAARSMFGFEKMIRSGQFTANRALGLRDRLGAIPLLIDDVTRDKFSSHVPDLVRTDQELGGQYAPVVLTTNRDVSTIPPDLTKRMVTCHIDAAIPENRSVTERIARRAQREIGTALYRAYLQRLIPEVRAMRAEIDAEAEHFPDLLARSSELLRGLLTEALGEPPAWACPLGFADYFGIRHRRFRDQLGDMLADAEDRVTVNRRTGELAISFGGDTNQAAQFARSVPDFVLKGRFADVVRLDLHALEQEMGIAPGVRRAWWKRLLQR
ncbi:MAG TPA: phospholipase D family protein [Acetobacteraceae bacterium]|nr:phospholipase D family protein [Acetobacteraceae bacterium]